MVFHPSVAAVLQYFDYRHLPQELKAQSRPFAVLAVSLAKSLDGPEVTVALRKLLEAKDAAVRARKARDLISSAVCAEIVAEVGLTE